MPITIDTTTTPTSVAMNSHARLRRCSPSSTTSDVCAPARIWVASKPTAIQNGPPRRCSDRVARVLTPATAEPVTMSPKTTITAA